MKGKDLMVEEGIQEVPEYAAVYLMCRGVSRIWITLNSKACSGKKAVQHLSHCTRAFFPDVETIR